MKIERLEGQFQEAGRDIEDLDVLGAGVHRAILNAKFNFWSRIGQILGGVRAEWKFTWNLDADWLSP